MSGEQLRLMVAAFGDAGHAWTRTFRADAIKTSIGGGGPQGARLQIEMLVAELACLN